MIVTYALAGLKMDLSQEKKGMLATSFLQGRGTAGLYFQGGRISSKDAFLPDRGDTHDFTHDDWCESELEGN